MNPGDPYACRDNSTEDVMYSFMNFLDRRSSQIRYAAFLKHGTGHAFECLGWLCPATFIFRLSRH